MLDLLVSRPTDRFDSLKRQEDWGKEVSLTEFQSFFDVEGRMMDTDKFKERVFYGGFATESQPKVCPAAIEGILIGVQGWKYLFGLWNADWTREKCEEVSRKKQEHYEAIRSQWETITADQVTLHPSISSNPSPGAAICKMER